MQYRPINWIVVVAIIVHGCWGILLLFTGEPLKTTPMAEAPYNFNRFFASGVYFFTAGTAFFSIIDKRFSRTWLGLLFCAPQQFLLMLSAFTAIRCVLRGAYADGVERPWEFILADQLWVIIGMSVHTISLLDWYGLLPWLRNKG